jgi:hypothetical protein
MSAGTLDQVSFAPETTWGTAVTPTRSIAVHPGDGMTQDVNPVFPTAIKASLHKNNSGSFKGQQKYDGSYDMDLIPGSAGYFFKSALGAVVSTPKSAPNAVVYDHAYTEQESKPSLTIEEGTSDLTYRFAGAIATGFKLSQKAGEALMASFGFKAKSAASATKITPAYETVRPFNFNDLGTTGLKIATVAKTEFVNFELDYKNNLEMLFALNGQGNPSFNYVKPSECHVKFELYMDSASAAEYVALLNKTTQQLDLTYTGDVIGSSANYGLAITIPKITYTVAKYPVTDNFNMITVEGEAEEDPTTGKLFTTFTLTNLLTGYP